MVRIEPSRDTGLPEMFLDGLLKGARQKVAVGRIVNAWQALKGGDWELRQWFFTMVITH